MAGYLPWIINLTSFVWCGQPVSGRVSALRSVVADSISSWEYHSMHSWLHIGSKEQLSCSICRAKCLPDFLILVIKFIIHIHIYIYTLWRGNMIPSYICRVMGKGGANHWPSADYSKKHNSGSWRAISLQISLLVQADMGMRKPHSLLAMYESVERGRPATMISAEWVNG